MAYITPVDVNTFYTNDDLDRIYQRGARIPWAVHVTGIDEIHSHISPEMADDDPDNEEFTQRTALKWAAERNAWHDKALADGSTGTISEYCVVLHNGEPWAPDPDVDGRPGEYCEWFDFDACEWFCSICFEVIKDGAAHCPTCAPTRFAGLKRLECDADPAHPALFMYADNLDGYNSPHCFYCILDHQREVESGRQHARHLKWYRWRITKRLLPVLKRVRLVRSWYWTSSATCNGCTSIRWRWTR